MVDARPLTDEIVVLAEAVTMDDIEPDPARDADRPRADKVHLSANLQRALKTAHARFVRKADRLGAQLPFVHAAAGASSKTVELSRSSRGIVMTAGGPYVGVALTSLLMLRRTGSTLPVQLFLDSDADYSAALCEDVLPALGTTCHVLQDVWRATPDMPTLTGYQLKALAILLSSFQQVLFLDADCWPLHRPDGLFDAAPFVSRGLVTWPDFWLSTAAPALYDILGVPAPRLADRRCSESGVLLYDKARHGASLVMAAYYNLYGPDFYYPLLSQGAMGQGDKETFLHAALAVGLPFYAVRTPTGVLGRRLNGTYTGAAMLQADPVDDARLVAGAVETVEATGADEEGELAHVTVTMQTQARWMFVHHNIFKVDLQHLGESMQAVYARNETGAFTRLWDIDDAFTAGVGYDVERALWEEVRRAVCAGRRALPTAECDDLERYYAAVFA